MIVVVTMTFVIIAGEIDLSVASVMGFGGVLAALHEHGVPFGSSPSRSPSPPAGVVGLIHGLVIARSACRRWSSRSPD